MTIGFPICISNDELTIEGIPVLHKVPSNVILTNDVATKDTPGVFLGVSTKEDKSHHLINLGTLRGLRFMCCFRFKLWWMTQRMGDRASQVPRETQFMLLEVRGVENEKKLSNESCDLLQPLYVVLLPLLDGSFRASLQGNEQDHLELCLESGDTSVKSSSFFHPLYVSCGNNPFDVISGAVRAVESHTKSFLHRENKKLPGILDYFGFCTWNAFYTDVCAEGVHKGLSSLIAGKTPPKFLIIDDGWQSVDIDPESTDPNSDKISLISSGTQYASRLTDIKENHKFRKLVNASAVSTIDPVIALRDVIKEAKDMHDIKYVYVWHALLGYWGGVKPLGPSVQHYKSELVYPTHSPGILSNDPEMAADSLTINGLGIVHPSKIYEFYDELHSYLSDAGIDGVKVDVQSIVETLGSGFGGRVQMSKLFQTALEKSIAKNFPDNGIIACMSQNTDSIYYSKQTAIVRASDDFWPMDPASQTIHIASVAYNSFFLGEFMQPDWDMFHSLHPAGEYHGAARAVGGCPVYVSDKPGKHNFELLRKLVLPDGLVLRALLPGRPTLDSLFVDPTRDDSSVLKIWNLNSCGGIIGAFNCQGAGWCEVGKKYAVHNNSPNEVNFNIRAHDVNYLSRVAPLDWNGDVIVHSHKSNEIIMLPKGQVIPLSLKVLDYELFTICPIKKLTEKLSFAPIGLTNMFNGGGAIMSVDYGFLQSQPLTTNVKLKVRGCGNLTMYASRRPEGCFVDDVEVDFDYSTTDCRLSLQLDFIPNSLRHVLVSLSSS